MLEIHQNGPGVILSIKQLLDTLEDAILDPVFEEEGFFYGKKDGGFYFMGDFFTTQHPFLIETDEEDTASELAFAIEGNMDSSDYVAAKCMTYPRIDEWLEIASSFPDIPDPDPSRLFPRFTREYLHNAMKARKWSPGVGFFCEDDCYFRTTQRNWAFIRGDKFQYRVVEKA